MANILTIDKKFIELITSGKMDKDLFLEILNSFGINNVFEAKKELIGIYLSVVYAMIQDKIITEEELLAAKNLKTIFEIKEGELFNEDKNLIQLYLCLQLSYYFKDGVLSDLEELEIVNFQDLFDLTYDQYIEIQHECMLKNSQIRTINNIEVREYFRNKIEQENTHNIHSAENKTLKTLFNKIKDRFL